MADSAEDFTSFIKSGNNVSSVDDVIKMWIDGVRELKKKSPAALDQALTSLDGNKHAHGIAMVLSAKACHPQCELDKTLKQVEAFMAGLTPKFPKLFDAHLLFRLLRSVQDRLIRDAASASGLDLFQHAIRLCQDGNTKLLTEVHSLFLQLCIQSEHMKTAVRFLEQSELSELPSSKYTDLDSCMNYFILASIVLSSFKYFISALDHILTLFYFPNITNSSSPLVTQAFKKYILLSALTEGKRITVPKYLHNQLEVHTRRNVAAYGAFLEQFNSAKFDYNALHTLAYTTHHGVFVTDGNWELVLQVLKKSKTKELTKIAKVFENIPVGFVMERLNLESVDMLENHLLDMANYSDTIGRINLETGYVTFVKKIKQTSKQQMLMSLQNAMADMQSMVDSMSDADREILSSSEYVKRSFQASDPSQRELHDFPMYGNAAFMDTMSVMGANGGFGLGFPGSRAGGRNQ